jgi:HPt (histidine-containing phosphotransfer) domain-containing protein
MSDQDPSPIARESMENLRQIGGGTDEFVAEIVQMFREDTPQRLQELDGCVARQDAAQLAKVAHSLKGAVSNFGAQRFRALAEQIEHAAKGGDLTSLPAASLELYAEYERILAALDAYLKAAR